MRSFDYELWMRRADTRRVNRWNRGEPNGATRQYNNDVEAINSLKKVIDWCDSRKINVTFTKISEWGEFDPATNNIKISSFARPETQLYVLLHEIGHYLIATCGSAKRRGSKGYSKNQNDMTFHYKVDLIDEEYEAWARGRKLAERLNLHIDCERFDEQKVKSLKSYFKWALGN